MIAGDLMNNAAHLRILAEELIKNTEDIARQTGLSFDAALGMTIKSFSQQNPGKPESYYQNLFREILNSTRNKHNNVIAFPIRHEKVCITKSGKETR